MNTAPRSPRQSAHRRRAFAAVTAIVLIGLVASTLAAMAMMFAADARRTRAAAEEAQIRQLLIAGATDVQRRLSRGETTFDVTSSAPADGTVQVSAAPSGESVEAVVTATLGRRKAVQTLRFARDGEQWNLVNVNFLS